MRLKPFYLPLIIAAPLCLPPVLARADAPPGQAAAPDEAGASAANAVSRVVVTAARSPQAAANVAASVTVLTAEQIRLDQETAISDILARTPGVTMTRTGGGGETTSLFIRGADADQTVVLLDGVKINDPTDPGAGYDFANQIVGDTARIEVLRGPQSTLYGSEAIGGVVNIVTADATRPLEGELQAEGGSYGTAYVRGALGGADGRFNWRVSAYEDTTTGISAFDKALGGREPDGFHAQGYSGRLRVDLTDALQLDERAYYTRGRAAFDGYDTPTFTFGDDGEWGRTTQFVDYTGLNLSLLDGRLKNRLAYEYSAIDRLDVDPASTPDATFIGTGRTRTIEYEGSFAIADGYQAVFGAESERSNMIAAAPAYYSPTTHANATVTSGYGQIVAEPVRNLTLTGGVRYDEHSAFGGHLTGQVSAAWRLNGGATVLRANFGQGFKAPSLYQLYSEYGVASLRPEQAEGWDLGVEQTLLAGKLRLQATYFGRTTHNLIDFVSCYGGGGDPALCASHPSGGYYANIDRSEAEGVELQADWRPTERLSVTANYTYDHAVDTSPGAHDLQLARRPQNAANLDVGYRWPVGLRTDVAVRCVGDSFNDAANTVRLSGYGLVDLRASYPLRSGVEVYARVENVADQHYETIYGYGTMGRAAYGGVRLSF